MIEKLKILHYPKLDSILRVEKAIQDSEEYPTRMELWKSLPKQMQYQTFKLILEYLENSNKIMFQDGKVIWIFANNKKLNKLIQEAVRVWEKSLKRFKMKEFIIQLSRDLFQIKTTIEKELIQGNKSNAELYELIVKTIDFLKARRIGEPISKKLPIFKYFKKKYGISNLFLIKLTKEARGFYTNTARDKFKILQIILEIHKSHKEYEKKGRYK